MNWYKIAIDEKDLGLKRDFAGLEINIENQAGTIRIGTDPEGKEWRKTMKYDYGFIHRIKGRDNDALDVYLGPNEDAEKVYIIHQVDPYNNHKYDEDKVMLGFNSEKDAKSAYLKHYDRKDFLGSITELDLKEFKREVEKSSGKKINWKHKNKKNN